MRYLAILLLQAILALPAFAQSGFKITGTIKGQAEGARVRIETADDEPVVLDSGVVSNGQFVLTGKVGYPRLCSVIIDTNDPTDESPDLRNKCFKSQFYLENSDIRFQGDITDMPAYYYNPQRRGKPVITGSHAQDMKALLSSQLNTVSHRLDSLEKLYIEEYHIPMMDGKEDSSRGIDLVRQIKEANNERSSIVRKFIAEHPQEAVSFDEISYIINGYREMPDIKEIDSLIALAERYWGNTPQLTKMEKDAARQRKLAKGQYYPDATFISLDGKEVSLSDVIPKGQYALLEFWASWCGPCRAEIPHLKRIHEQYPGFAMISVSVDSNDKSWKKAVDEENMSWLQLRNIKGMDGVAKDIYQVFAVPTCLLIDPQGRFCGKDMRGAYLDEFLSSQEGKKD